MNWEKLKETAKEMGAEISTIAKEKIVFRNLVFFADGTISQVYDSKYDMFGSAFAQGRTPAQMLAIMKAIN